ncbi:2-oxoadipate dioxygenase/decarboxylase, chloroplastic-like [Bidens hawaiensis]|uniref:2-oxoadipate dioxygenase/decarboxylase, chloroplastic-like n=1 Tax=Bidens hawaiensis TaxID=980011 RepID=UPI00404B1325
MSLPTLNHHKLKLSIAASHGSQQHYYYSSSSQELDGGGGDHSFFRSVLSNMEQVYLNRNPTATKILELVHSTDANQICYDHLAFRTFGVNGHGIESMSKLFLDFGYTQREELRFPKKKLKALWFSPPPVSSRSSGSGSGFDGPLPRVFISELLVDQMSQQAQDIIRKYTGLSGAGHKHSALSSALGCLTWPKPSHSEFQQLAKESEYAAWTLVNGYALNHVTISIHRLKPPLNDIDNLNHFIQDKGFKLNSEGGVLKVSPDGLLLQSSTVADSVPFEFSDGFEEQVPCSYIEFAQRLVLPQYKDLPQDKVEEVHRRDGFEVGNADKIFESTSQDQLTRRA